MDFSLYNKVNSILGNFSLVYYGVDLRKTLSFDLAFYLSKPHSLSFYLKCLVKCFMPIHSTFDWSLLKDNRIVFSSTTERKDYIELIELVRSNFNQSCLLFISRSYCRHFVLKNIFTHIYELKSLNKCHCDIFSYLFLASRLLNYCVFIKTLDETKPNYIHLDNTYNYIPLNSSHALESVITQYFNARSVKTFHLCHGLHFSPNIRYFTVDSFNKELITAKTVLSWGENFVFNDNKYYKHNYRHVIVGNPKYHYRKINTSFNSDTCIVFLARISCLEGNLKLLKMLNSLKNDLSIRFYIKPHPSLDQIMIDKLCNKWGFFVCDKTTTIRELLTTNSFGFAISYESTAYFEAMYYNLVCFRYAYNENENYGDFDNRFLSLKDLKYQIHKYSSIIDKETLSAKIEEVLVKEIGMGINEYRKAILG